MKSEMASTWIEITPRGVRRGGRPLADRLSEVVSNLKKVRFIVWSNLRLQAFGHSLGWLIWSLIEPALAAFVYWVLVRVIGGLRGDAAGFLFIYSALTFWRSHANLVSTAHALLFARGVEILQTNISMQILYYEFIGTELALFVTRFWVLIVFLLVGGIAPQPAWLLVLPLTAVVFLFATALAMWVSIVGVFIRDIGRALYLVVTLWWYVSPGIYPASRIPARYHTLFYLNPFAHIFPAIQTVMIEGKIPDLVPLVNVVVFSVVLIAGAAALLSRIRHRLHVLL